MKALLVGNGVNRLFNQGISWEEVLNRLLKFALGDTEIELKEVPFPIVYEEIFLRSTRIESKEESLLDELALYLKDIKKNIIHDELINLGVTDIITSNYDYAFFDGNNKTAKLSSFLDWSHNPFFTGKEESKNGSGLERLYRFRTYYEQENVRYWHIHGEMGYTNTIVLGHDKYSKVISRMEDYLGNGIKDKDPFKFDQIKYGWMDLFFISDIDILGLQMHYTEIDIWYLLNQRARKIKTMGLDKKVPNRIRYFDLSKEDVDLDDSEDKGDFKTDDALSNYMLESSYRSKKAFVEILEAHYIEYVEIKKETYLEAYKEYLRSTKESKD